MYQLFFCFCLFVNFNVWSSDLQREQLYKKEVLAQFNIGSAIYLRENKFLALYTETESVENRGTAILLHDAGQHPDKRPLIHNLRTQLPEHQWATLSIQLPIYEFGAKTDDYFALFPESFKRIQAAVDYLQKNNVENIALVGYGLGGLMAVQYLNESQNTAIKAIAAISLPVPERKNKYSDTLACLKNVNAPLLDIFGSADRAATGDSARKKRIAARQNPQYRQVVINDSARSFQNYQQLVVKRIYSWLIQVSDN